MLLVVVGVMVLVLLCKTAGIGALQRVLLRRMILVRVMMTMVLSLRVMLMLLLCVLRCLCSAMVLMPRRGQIAAAATTVHDRAGNRDIHAITEKLVLRWRETGVAFSGLDVVQ